MTRKQRFPASWLALALGLFSLGADSAAPAPGGQRREKPLSLRELTRAWTSTTPITHPGAGTGTLGRAGAIGMLAEGHAADPQCATPLFLALYQNAPRLNPRTRSLVEAATRPPAGKSTRVAVTPDGLFRIHYSIDPGSPDRVDPYDGDLDGIPDGVERISDQLSDLMADVVHDLEWAPAPALAPSPASPHSVPGLLTHLDEGATDLMLVGLRQTAGQPEILVSPPPFAWPPARATIIEAAEASDAVIFLDSALASRAAQPRPALAHALAHLVQMRESTWESIWWDEASATWIGNRLAGDAAAVAASFGADASRRAQGFDDDTLGLSIEGFLWPHYLTLSAGADAALLRRIWEEMATQPGNNTFEAIDRVLRRSLGTSLVEETRVFNVWNLFLGAADDGRHYPFGSLLPTPQGDATFDTFPARGASPTGPIHPFGSALIRLLGDGTSGGLRIRFLGEQPGVWDVSLVVYSARSGEIRHVAVEVDATGRGYIALPWKSLGALDLMIQNLGAPRSGTGEYTFDITYDATVPFDLLTFTADNSGSGAMLNWSTESEERVAGWSIFRGPGPLGPFTRVNQYLLPGAGRAEQEMSYVFVDSTVEPGRKYYYYLQGMTFEGFTENSHPAGVRIGRAPHGSLSSR